MLLHVMYGRICYRIEVRMVHLEIKDEQVKKEGMEKLVVGVIQDLKGYQVLKGMLVSLDQEVFLEYQVYEELWASLVEKELGDQKEKEVADCNLNYIYLVPHRNPWSTWYNNMFLSTLWASWTHLFI